MDETVYDVLIIGGGCVGLAAAYKIILEKPHLKIAVLEKESKLATHQTGRNSGVIHSGIYYKPGSYKAKNCVEGRRELVAFSKHYQIPHDICGKIIVATHMSELDHMNSVFENGIKNEVEGIEKINADQIREREPFCTGIEGIWVPCTGIIDYVALCNKLAELICAGGGKIMTGMTVRHFIRQGTETIVIASERKFKSRYIINCSGLFADRIAALQGVKPDMQIVGFRGDYYELSEKGMKKVRNLIYPVPNPEFPFLGVHFTRLIQGGVECGPNAVFTFKREGYSKSDFNLKDTIQALSFKGTWKLFFNHWRFGLDEYRRAFSKKLFLERLQKLIPSLTMEDIIPGRSGVRAMALAPDGNMIDDFKISYHDHALHVLNAPSPAATACLAIGSAIRTMANEHFSYS
ncbi:MAG: L-2-hydroxyglutarate oxidase [Bacteroidia bacterium]|nr:L-2-hydroxyglutarate oxidase [Bacteroidia bacterium]MCZ2278307.1 L-2-hydroxyglutarate oxidase [Bacteroidia bacterium]